MGQVILQFVEGSGLGAGLIRWYDHGQYSHVDTVLPDGTLLGARDDTIAGIPPGVQIRPASYVAGETVRRVILPVSDVQEAAYYAFLQAQVGKPYDEAAIAAFAAGTTWSSPGSWFCSMLVAYGLQLVKVFNTLSEDTTKVAPDTLLLLISALFPI